MLYSRGIERYRAERCYMLLSCSDKVSNITISPSSPKNCYKPIWKIAPIYSAQTVSSSRWQCKLLGWITPVSFRGVYQRGSITHRPKSEVGQPRLCTSSSLPPLPPSFSLLFLSLAPSLSPANRQLVFLPQSRLLLMLRTQDGAQSHHCMATLEAVEIQYKTRWNKNAKSSGTLQK